MAKALRAVGKSWMDDIVSTKITEAKKINALLYGPGGGGKTTFIGTAPRPFVLWCEEGDLALGAKDIPGYKFDSDNKFYDTVMSIAQSARINEGPFADIDTIAIDSIWKMNQLCLAEICRENGVDGPRIQDWGTLRNRMGAMINMFLSIDKHFIGTLGETTKENDMTGQLEYVFNMNGGYAGQIHMEFDFLLYMNEEVRGSTSYYKMFTKTKNGHKAKSRVVLPAIIENSTFDKLWSAAQEAGSS